MLKKYPASHLLKPEKFRKRSVLQFYFFFNRTNCLEQDFPDGLHIIAQFGHLF